MKVLIVLAHPKPDSFNAAVCAALTEGLHKAGHTTDLADLYAERFDPVMGAGELATLGTAPPAPDVAAYQKRILEADALVFVFPVWWFGVPAVLKGFIDRVFQENFAFRLLPGGKAEGLLHHSRALLLCTAGASAAVYRLFGFGRPMKRLFGDWTLRMCGVGRVRLVTFHGVADTDDATRRRYLTQACRLGREFFGALASTRR